jgi:nitrite reductase/ring-hydroxylating ferredoxin subunit
MKLVEVNFADQISEGQMKELKVGDGELDTVLITKYKGELRAIGAYCTHLGAPLVNGLIFDDKVLCPYHLAGYSVVTGAFDGGPGLDNV